MNSKQIDKAVEQFTGELLDHIAGKLPALVEKSVEDLELLTEPETDQIALLLYSQIYGESCLFLTQKAGRKVVLPLPASFKALCEKRGFAVPSLT